MSKPSFEVAQHEAAHAVCHYLHDLPIHSIQVWASEGVLRSASSSSADPFSHAVSLLSANAYMTTQGLPTMGFDDDFQKASILVALEFTDRPKAAREAFGLVCEAARALVRTQRFLELVAMLTPKLAERNFHNGPDVIRFLKEHDPYLPARSVHAARREVHRWGGAPGSAPVSRILHDDGTRTLYSYGDLLISRGSQAEVEARSQEILDQVWHGRKRR